MSSSDASAPPVPVRRPNAWLAWSLIAVGGLVAALCGGTAVFLGLAIFLGNDMSNPDNVYWLQYFVLLAGAPAVIGLAILGAGILLLRRLHRRIADDG